MPLLKFWGSNPDEVLSMNLEGIVGMAGSTGKLRDGNDSSAELRQYLSEIPSERLSEYALYCLQNSFPNSGQVLQDVVNEIGHRLAFNVEHGRYQGVRNAIGYDGIWRLPNSDRAIVVEVKTTDAYTIPLNTIANYRDRLAEEGRVPRDAPTLLVIGRDDTHSLEAQVRGSRHAWSMRIISVDALVKLMAVNLSTSTAEVTEKIHTILQPMEYTRLDALVDIMFAATEDKASEAAEVMDFPGEIAEEDCPASTRVQDRTSRDVLNAKKESAVRSLATQLGKVLVKRKHSMYGDNMDTVHVVVALSKRYDRAEPLYWYAYHDTPQRVFLRSAPQGFMLFSMVDLDECFAVPVAVLDQHWDDLYQTTRANGKSYKHIHIVKTSSGMVMKVGTTNVEIDLRPYRVSLQT